MNKTNLLLSAFIFSAMFLLGCSSDTTCDCKEGGGSSSSGVKPSSSSSPNTNPPDDQKLIRKKITLSLDSSYADIDVPAVYTKEYATNNLKKIDFVARCGSDIGCKNNSIYTPKKIVDVFWDPGYVGGKIYIFEIPPEYAEDFITAQTFYEIIPAYNNLIDLGLISGVGVEETSIEEGKVFYVITSEDKEDFVIIKASNSQSVELQVFEVPR